MVGGFERDGGGTSAAVERYDVRRNRWSRVRPGFPFGSARNHTRGVAAGGPFYVIAGSDAENFTAVERYDPRRRAWEDVPDLRTPRHGVGGAALDNRVYAIEALAVR